MSRQQEPPSERRSSSGRTVDARQLWSGGAATAVVAALIALAGILVCRWLFNIPILAPRQDGAWGNASTAGYAIAAAAAALAATAIMHLLLIATPRPQRHARWHRIGALLVTTGRNGTDTSTTRTAELEEPTQPLAPTTSPAILVPTSVPMCQPPCFGSAGNHLCDLGPRHVNLGNAKYRWESQGTAEAEIGGTGLSVQIPAIGVVNDQKPRTVYLDINHWYALARHIYARPDLLPGSLPLPDDRARAAPRRRPRPRSWRRESGQPADAYRSRVLILSNLQGGAGPTRKGDRPHPGQGTGELTTGTRPSASYRGERDRLGRRPAWGGKPDGDTVPAAAGADSGVFLGLLARYHVARGPGPVSLLPSVTQPSHNHSWGAAPTGGPH